MHAPFRRVLVRLYALTGAMAFGLSLASGIWLYRALGSASAAEAGGDNSPAWGRALAVNLLLFGLFAMHHSLLARSGAKIVLTRWLPPALERSTYVWIASLLFLLVTAAWQPMPGVAYEAHGALAWLLSLVQLAGVLLTLLAAAAIDPRELAGLRQAWQDDAAEAVSLDALESRPVTFTVRGAYGLVRHPIYLGWFLMVWGAPRMTWGRVAFAAISSLYLILAIPWEERSLDARHGDAYRRYCTQVRWRVLPGLY